MRQLSIVILNFNTYEYTLNCVRSILFHHNHNYEIIIVDNSSQNDSFKHISREFRNQANVHILALSNNLGYSKGNNIGIYYSLNELKIKNVLILNNDTIIKDKTTIKDMLDISKDYGLISPSLVNQFNESDDGIYVKNGAIYSRFFKVILLTFFDMLPNIIKFPLTKFKRAFSTKQKSQKSSLTFNKNDLYIHGACFLLTENFFKSFNSLFPNTFLYNEEYNTLMYIKKASLKTNYLVTVPVIHFGSVSTKRNNINRFKKNILMLRSSFSSLILVFISKKFVMKNFSFNLNQLKFISKSVSNKDVF